MYIRTENHIYEVESILKDNGFIKGYNVGEMAFIRKDQVINQSENLAELCDEFVLKTTSKESGKSYYGLYYYSDIKHFKVKEGFKGTWYGAIWTDKGLIYVAKMNDKGELVLI